MGRKRTKPFGPVFMTKAQASRSAAAMNAWNNKTPEQRQAHLAKLHAGRKRWHAQKKKWGDDVDFGFNK